MGFVDLAGAPRRNQASSRPRQDPARRLRPGLAFEARGPCFEVRRVSTRSFDRDVNVRLPAIDLDHLAGPATGREPVEHVTVVGDEHECRAGGRQPGLEPLDRFEVEVVGRLVEHDQVVLAHERLGERHPLGLAARQLVGPASEQRLHAERSRDGGHLPSHVAFAPATLCPTQILGHSAGRETRVLVERGDANAAAEAHGAFVG